MFSVDNIEFSDKSMGEKKQEIKITKIDNVN